MKTITISDDVYEKLVRIKGKKSFSAIIDELIKRNVNYLAYEAVRQLSLYHIHFSKNF